MQMKVARATQSPYIAGALSYLIHFDLFLIHITVAIVTTKRS